MFHVPLDAWAQWMPHNPPHGPMGPYHGPHGPHTGMGMWEMGGGWFVPGLVGMLLVLVVAVAVVGLVLMGGGGFGRRSSATDPLEALRIRYARGEVDDEEFDRRRALLLESRRS